MRAETVVVRGAREPSVLEADHRIRASGGVGRGVLARGARRVIQPHIHRALPETRVLETLVPPTDRETAWILWKLEGKTAEKRKEEKHERVPIAVEGLNRSGSSLMVRAI